MLYLIDKGVGLKNLYELVSLQNQGKASRLQGKAGKQSLHEDKHEVFEPVLFTVKDITDDVTKTLMVTSIEINRAGADSQSHARSAIANPETNFKVY